MAQINKPSDYFNTVLYTGNGVDGRTITGVGFNPDMSWVKSRSNAVAHIVADSVRGANKNIVPNETGAEFNPTTDVGSGGIGQVTTDGFTCEQGTSSLNNTNASGYTYASWNWLANGSGSANTDGSIASTVSANATSGFSIVSYTGTGANATVGHGLGVAPSMIIVKNRSAVTHWMVGCDSIAWTNYLVLSLTQESLSDSQVWNNTAPTSNVFSVGIASPSNGSGNNLIAYCFAEKKGYSKFGSYTGNGSADGTFVYTGFKPAFVMIKRTDATDSWYILDTKRGLFNSSYPVLIPNSSGAEFTTDRIDLVSNGFKQRYNWDAFNASGGSYIYMAFAENPLVGTNNIPATAR